jgi:diguanylate cyclase (GGDEF)-like protein
MPTPDVLTPGHIPGQNPNTPERIGDRMLNAVAGQLQSVVRKQDMVIRWGGEEFLIVMPDTTAENAEMILDRFMQATLCPRPDGSGQTASVGIADSGEADTAAELLEAADTRMYLAKKHGKSQIVGPPHRRTARAVAVAVGPSSVPA